MPPLSWNEIRARALAFAREWEGEESEKAEAKTFWDEFFNIFGVTRRRVASFEKSTKKSDGRGGFIDLLWKGVLLVEHKSRGQDLDTAYSQALDYFPGLVERDLPQYVVISDFARFRLYDLDHDLRFEFPLEELHEHVHLFAFIAGYKTETFGEQNPVNMKAAEALGALHDRLKEAGYAGHDLEVFLVRVLFSLFAEDTGIFERRRQFQDYIEQRTQEDGSDVGMHLAQLFDVLDTETALRQATLDEQLAEFPYIDGRLFEARLPITAFDRQMRETLLDCCAVDWSEISPAIFGSLFQSIMDTESRRYLGAHYTEERNILKALRPLFLNDLREELDRIKSLRRGKKSRLNELRAKLAKIRILDPACGCGNFLVVAYRELRLLELEVLRELYGSQMDLHGVGVVQVDVDQFYGIEIEDFPGQVAQVALWLTDHQMNLKVSEEFGQYFVRLPLAKAPTIVHGDALLLDWATIAPPGDLSYIVGNPPYAGKKEQSRQQSDSLSALFAGVDGAGILDYVSGWYVKAVDYMKENPEVRTALVSTNSITQGEQVSVLWSHLLSQGAQLDFAHRTFQWTSEAPGKAAVHCVILGFSVQGVAEKWLFEYDRPKSDPHVVRVNRINPYLVDGPDVLIAKRYSVLSNGAPQVSYGSMPIDNGHLILSKAEAEELIRSEKAAKPYIRPYVGGKEAISGQPRYCLWLESCSPHQLRQMPSVLSRVQATKEFRENSGRAQTRELAATPYLFGEIRQPSDRYLLIPKVSSELREYIPIAFFEPTTVASGSALIMSPASLYDFGVLSSAMHVAWVRSVGGRMKSDLQYSSQIVYNNFPWPQPSTPQRKSIEKTAEAVLAARSEYSDSSLADLYDPRAMPQRLNTAHRQLDRAVARAYRSERLNTVAERAAHLFHLYGDLDTADELP